MYENETKRINPSQAKVADSHARERSYEKKREI